MSMASYEPYELCDSDLPTITYPIISVIPIYPIHSYPPS